MPWPFEGYFCKKYIYKLLVAKCQVENMNSIAKNLIIKNFQGNGKKCQGFSYKSSGSPTLSLNILYCHILICSFINLCTSVFEL